MNEISVTVQHLSKRYNLGQTNPIKSAAIRVKRSLFETFKQQSNVSSHNSSESGHIWALKDVSFDVRQGEVLGIIGRNGSGKSTLLKILTRITKPSNGFASLRGHASSLLEVGTGFHPELTGRENVYLNGAILGMNRNDLDLKFDEIVEFSGVERFIDTPVKRYSSGMQVRLAFSVAAHLDPEILLIDEVLAVGDAEFQRKCLGKMGDAATEGRTILFVSHNMHAIATLCDRCLWLDQGRIVQDGPPEQTVLAYLSDGQAEGLDGSITPDMHVNDSGEIYFRRVMTADKSGKPTQSFFFGSPIRVIAEVEVCRPVEALRMILAIERSDGSVVTVLHHPENDSEESISALQGYYSLQVDLEARLTPGSYYLHLAVKHMPDRWNYGESLEYVPRALDFHVEEVTDDGQIVRSNTGGLIHTNGQWDFSPGRLEN